jgi:flagellar hook protein FlgE
MLSAFSTALSALSANGTAVDIIGNNLANLNTTGYKGSAAQFHDLLSQELGIGSSAGDLGLGVGPVNAVRHFTQGPIQTTGGALDAAISGDGFFVVKNGSGQTLYTRAGNFRVDTNGNLLTASGEYVQGWNASGGVLSNSSAVGNITVPVGAVVPAIATTKVSADINVDARAAKDATFSAPIEVVDSLGATHTLTVNFKKTDTNKWDYTVTIPEADLKSGGTAASISNGSLSFDSSGQLTSPASGSDPVLKITGLADGAADMNVTLNLYNGTKSRFTQLAQASGLSAVAQNGMASGQIVKIGMGDHGILMAQYSNGQEKPIAQLALATIQNPETLSAVGNNNLQATVDTAQAAIGAPKSGGRGDIQGGSLESSNVDIAREFTNLITVQRSYQANARVVTTTDELLQETLTLKR